MTAAAKFFVMLLSNKKVRNTLIGILVGTVVFFIMLLGVVVYEQQNSSKVSGAAAQAIKEYDYWQNNAPSDDGLSCQGEKYCSYYNSGITDWCCFFAGYCYKESGLTDEESGYASVTNIWTDNLKKNGNLETAASGYVPKIGNPVFFNYDGRANYAATDFVAHVGIVVEVSDNNITVIAGNEYNGNTSDWASVSYVNKYMISVNNDSIACYGSIGNSTTISTGINATVRNIICRNEIGVLYDEINEDNYGSVIANDNGALSIGVYGWHGDKALSLLQTAYNSNPNEIENIALSYGTSGKTVVNAIKNNYNWSVYIPDENVCHCIRAILFSTSGKQAQDITSLEDAQQYVDICAAQGLTDSRAIAYCCDILNQWGVHSFEGGVLDGVTSSMSLDDIYISERAWRDSKYDYRSRRTWTYQHLKNLSDSIFFELPTEQVLS